MVSACMQSKIPFVASLRLEVDFIILTSSSFDLETDSVVTNLQQTFSSKMHSVVEDGPLAFLANEELHCCSLSVDGLGWHSVLSLKKKEKECILVAITCDCPRTLVIQILVF